MRLRMTTTAGLLLALAALAPAGADAQEPRATAGCPTVTVSCPDSPSPGKTDKFTANVSSGDLSVTPTFKWSVSGGKIISGQGTHEIVVEAEGKGPQTATVNVGGYPSFCQTSAACTAYVCGLTRMSRKVDEYGEIKPNEEKQRLGSFAHELRNDPTARGYLLIYAGRRARKDEARRRGESAKNYLVGELGMDPTRVIAVDGGHREERTVELFLVPSGATPPSPTPTVSVSDVEFVKHVPPSRARRPKGHNRR